MPIIMEKHVKFNQLTGKSLVLSALALKAKEDEKFDVGFVSMGRASESIFNDAVRRFCEGNNMRMLPDEERAPLQNYLQNKLANDDIALTNTVTELSKKYDCLFFDEILLESYHSH